MYKLTARRYHSINCYFTSMMMMMMVVVVVVVVVVRLSSSSSIIIIMITHHYLNRISYIGVATKIKDKSRLCKLI